ncbi:hypothetical protein WJ33_04255 [Burkholderia ubonensis]|uniref:Uncharacterized protein n=1 Tax=Burkholderia ubonensis TaxID=101571 RepID=A0A103QX95_9BURK|nr:hypothetical protein WJ33_04255 [Burkholderia ubonensis]
MYASQSSPRSNDRAMPRSTIAHLQEALELAAVRALGRALAGVAVQVRTHGREVVLCGDVRERGRAVRALRAGQRMWHGEPRERDKLAAHATGTRCTKRHQVPLRSLQRATSAPSMVRSSPASRSATSGRPRVPSPASRPRTRRPPA